jgi:hypothetical protein
METIATSGKRVPARSSMLLTRSGDDIMVDFMKPPWFEEGPAEAVDHQTTVMGRTPASRHFVR